jgi:STE24 endopeptidase
VNPYAAIVLGALVGELALETTTDVLTLRALEPSVPPELRGVYDPERYRRTRAYTRARVGLGLVGSVVDRAVLLVFWFAGGFGRLDAAVRDLGLPGLATGLVFVGAVGLGRMLLALPFRWWSTFVVEARFGFNRTTARTFWLDAAKALVLAVALGAPLLAAVLWLFTVAGLHAWLWCWLAVSAFTVLVQFVAPTWILPLFNRFTPLPPGPLREAIVAYARSVAFPLADVFVIDGSRRSTKGNALFTGFGRTKRIALFDTLVDTLAPPEIVAVVAHEVGHYRRGHVLKGTAIGVVHVGLLLFVFSLLVDRRALFAAFFVPTPSVHVGIVLFALLLAPLDVAVSLALNAWSRRNEREADAFAARTTGAAGALARALEHLSADSLTNPTPHRLDVLLRWSHPPLRDRLRALAGA